MLCVLFVLCSEFLKNDCAAPFTDGDELGTGFIPSLEASWYELDAVLMPGGVCGTASVVSGDWRGTVAGIELSTGSLRYVAGFIDKDGNVLCPVGGTPSPVTSRNPDCSAGRRPVQVTCGQLQIYVNSQ